MKVGDIVGSYRVTAAIGEGGMGSVWKAFDERLERAVALKVLKLPPSSDGARSEASERFLREARALAKLNHPRVVTIFEVGESDAGESFLAMELVEGRSLKAHLDAGPIEIERGVRWLTDLAGALAAVHDAGIVHRDVKPANVVVTSPGEIKLVDFGIARAGSTEPTEVSATMPAGLATLTRSDATIGTPLYMAPEQIRGDALGPGADQFAWGVTAYELLAGHPPWSGESGIQVLSAILEREPPPLRPDRCPEHVARVVTRALAKDRGARFASMRDLVAALAGTDATVPASSLPPARRTGEASAERPPAIPPPTSRAARAGIVVAAGVAVAAAAAAVVFGGVPGDGVAPSASAPASSSAPTSDDPAAPLRIKDLPIPESPVAEAREAYRAGLRAMSTDGSGSAIPLFERAATLDPAMAAARVRLLVIGSWFAGIDVGPRFDEARAHEANLSARDRQILDAVEPFYRLDPSDRDETRRRLHKLLERRPRDAELWLFLTGGISVYSDPEFLGGFDKALAVEPGLPDALGFRVQHCAYTGDAACVAAAERACQELAPTTLQCLHYRSEQAEERGDCLLAEELGRSMLKNGTAREYGYRALLAGMGSSGRSRQAMEAVIEAGRADGGITPAKVASSRANVAALFGDFEASLADVTEAEAIVGQTRSLTVRAAYAQLRAKLAQESGRRADAAELAREFLDLRDGLQADPHGDDFAIVKDATPNFLRVLGESGGDPVDVAHRRDQWIADWKRRLRGSSPSYIWLQGWAGAVHDVASAQAALDARPAFEPIATFRPRATSELAEGRMYRLLGKWSEAEERLRRATKVCRAATFPLEHVQAHELLGRVLEKKGDEAGACDAYGYVIERWGQAKPKSVTADRARERIAALHCKATSPRP